MFPPIPAWEGLHPIAVHFPIALLSIVPLFLLLAFLPKSGKSWAFSALVLLVLGTAGSFVAVATGEATADAVQVRVPAGSQAHDVLEQHEELAERVRTAYVILTLAYAGFLIIPRFFEKKMPALAESTSKAVFLGASLGCVLMVVNTGHLGGRLVHEFGITAPMAASQGNQPIATDNESNGRKRRGHDD